MKFNFVNHLIASIKGESISKFAQMENDEIDSIESVEEMSRFLKEKNRVDLLDNLIDDIQNGQDLNSTLENIKKEYKSPEAEEKSDIEKKYDLFKAEYDKSTGKSWPFEKFVERSRNWTFYGDEKGFVAVRFQRSGYVKLVGMAGSMRSKLVGLKQLLDQNLPLWGMVSDQIAELAKKVGFIVPPQFIVNQIIKHIDPSVLANAQAKVVDSGIQIDYSDVGSVVKKLIVTKPYIQKFIKETNIPMSGMMSSFLTKFLESDKPIKTAQIYGEWWIDATGNAIYADGDIGDLNHVAYAEEHARHLLDKNGHIDGYLTEQAIQIRDKLIEKEQNKDDEHIEKLKRALNSLISSDTENFVLSYMDEMKELGLTPIDFDLLMMATGHHKDPRQYAMKKWGWKRVAGKMIETWTLTQNDLKLISRGLEDIFQEEYDTDSIKVDIEVSSTNKTYRDIPISVIDSNDVSQILQYAKKYSYANRRKT